MKKAIFLMGLLALFLFSATGCTQTTTSVDSSLPKVGVTFYPFYDMTKHIAGEDLEVFSVVPKATEPHSYTPTPKDIAQLQNIDVYVATGVSFEAFEETLVDSLSKDVPIIKAGEDITLLTGGHDHDHGEHEEDEEKHMDEKHEEEVDSHLDNHEDEMAENHHGDEEEHVHTEMETTHDEEHLEGTDPHIWLSSKNAIIITEHIAHELEKLFPEKANKIHENAQEYVRQLEELDQSYSSTLLHCEKDTVLVTHNAYSYMAYDYDFTVVSISGLSPESEPTPKQIVELIEEAKEHNVSVVYFEEMVDPRVAQTIADEVGAQTLTLNPVAGSLDDKGYIEIMYDNLHKLAIGLECN